MGIYIHKIAIKVSNWIISLQFVLSETRTKSGCFA